MKVVKVLLNGFIALLVVFLVACSAFEKADYVVMSGAAEKAVLSIDYTQAEVETIRQAITEYGAFHAKWQDFIENPVVLLQSGQKELKADYGALRGRYQQIEQIITANFDRYDETTRAQLLKYQKMAHDVDDDMRTIKTVSDAMTYGALIAQIAAKML